MRRSLLGLLVSVTGLAGSAASAADVLSGKVSLPEHAVLSPASQLEVALVDLDALDEDERVLGSLRIDNFGSQALRFDVPFDTGRLRRNHHYAVRAAIRDNGAIVYAGEKPIAAHSPLANLNVALHATTAGSGAYPASASPVGQEWRIVEVDGEHLQESDPPLTLGFAPDGKLTGFAGCNRLLGHYELADGVLKLAQPALTRMACAPAVMALESRVVAALAAAATIRGSADVLEIRDAAGVPRLRLEAWHPHTP